MKSIYSDLILSEKVVLTTTQYLRTILRKIYSHRKNISSNHLFSNFFSKNDAFTKFLPEKCESKLIKFPQHTVEIYSHEKKFRQITCLIKMLLSRNVIFGFTTQFFFSFTKGTWNHRKSGKWERNH